MISSQILTKLVTRVICAGYQYDILQRVDKMIVTNFGTNDALDRAGGVIRG